MIGFYFQKINCVRKDFCFHAIPLNDRFIFNAPIKYKQIFALIVLKPSKTATLPINKSQNFSEGLHGFYVVTYDVFNQATSNL